ncbi:hypothetical protein C8R44DRAFT_886721 [Mycena epipterygia]|nr:hypothetical protein C8R44DRAFT_886721 [Mycena epipterygia]
MLIGQAASICSFAQESLLPSNASLGVAEPDFSSQLSKYLRKYAPDAPLSIVQQSSTSIYAALPEVMVPGVSTSYPISWLKDSEIETPQLET